MFRRRAFSSSSTTTLPFLDIDAIARDLLTGPPVNMHWGHMMALVEPNRIRGDKYFVPHDVYPMQYYPPYARGMAYALSEDLAVPLGEALSSMDD